MLVFLAALSSCSSLWDSATLTHTLQSARLCVLWNTLRVPLPRVVTPIVSGVTVVRPARSHAWTFDLSIKAPASWLGRAVFSPEIAGYAGAISKFTKQAVTDMLAS